MCFILQGFLLIAIVWVIRGFYEVQTPKWIKFILLKT